MISVDDYRVSFGSLLDTTVLELVVSMPLCVCYLGLLLSEHYTFIIINNFFFKIVSYKHLEYLCFPLLWNKFHIWYLQKAETVLPNLECSGTVTSTRKTGKKDSFKKFQGEWKILEKNPKRNYRSSFVLLSKLKQKIQPAKLLCFFRYRVIVDQQCSV